MTASRTRRAALITLSIFFIAAGAAHFIWTGLYVAVMPPYLPLHLELVYLSGAFEILGGLAILPRRTRVVAGWGLIMLLLAVFPANIHMAMNPEPYIGWGWPLWALYARLPLQVLLAAWVWYATLADT